MYTSLFKREPRTNSTLPNYTEFQKQSVKISTEDKHRETRKFASFFKREPQGKYESTLKFTNFIRFARNNFAG